MKPQARKDKVLVQEVGDELVVYDQERHEAHRLNPTAALVWRQANGRRTAADLAAMLHEKLGLPADEEVVRLALDDLDRARLLSERPAALEPISRRELLDRLKVAAYLLPVVASIVAPTPLAAQSGTTPPTAPNPPAPTPGATTFTFSGTGMLTGQTGNCNYRPSFQGTFAVVINGVNMALALTESVLRNYSCSLQSNGQFSCTGNNSFNGCTDNSTCTGTLSPNITNPTSFSCDEVNHFTQCCIGDGTYRCTATR